MNENQQICDKLVQVFSCEMIESKHQKSNWKKGKLFLKEKSLHFSSLFHYSATQFNFKQQLMKLEYSQIQQFEENEENDQIIITTHNQHKHIFRNFFNQRQQAMEILRSINLQPIHFQPIQENDSYDWDSCNEISQQILPQLLKLREGNKYNEPTTFELEGLEIHQIFALLYDDQPYQPSEYFSIKVKEVDKNKTYQNVLHFFFEQILGDQEIKCNPWYPQIPQYLRTGYLSQGPSSDDQTIDKLPTRIIDYVHPTKLPFFGTINPKVKMTQRLLLINQNEFIVQVQSETSGLPKSDCYKMMSHEKAIRIGNKKFRIECTFTIEWQSRIMIISNQVDNAAAIESKRVLETFYIPYAKSRLFEMKKTIENERIENEKQLQLEEQSNKSTIIGLQPSMVHMRRQVKSESQVFPIQFSPESQKYVDYNTQRIQELDSGQQKLENQIKQLQLQIVLQDNKIKRIGEEQQASLLLSRTFGLIILVIIISNWILK